MEVGKYFTRSQKKSLFQQQKNKLTHIVKQFQTSQEVIQYLISNFVLKNNNKKQFFKLIIQDDTEKNEKNNTTLFDFNFSKISHIWDKDFLKKINHEEDSSSDYDPDKDEEEDDIWYTEEEEEYLEKLKKKNHKNKLKNIKKLEQTVLKFNKPKVPFRFRILRSNLSMKNKKTIIDQLDYFNELDTTDSDYFKLKTWIDTIQKVPFGINKQLPISFDDGEEKIQKFIQKSYSILEESVWGHQTAKLQILQIISKWIRNPNSSGNVIALCGPMGNGKTTLVKNGISKAIEKPFTFVSLGGAQDSSFLQGHDFTYEGSRCGRIIEILTQSGCMNPIIFFDELDKLSETPKGREISNLLCHITDPSQNDVFQDKFLSGIEFDLSKALFIFSFNDETKINPILKDRINVIKMDGFKLQDKINIIEKHLLPDLCKEYNLNPLDIKFDKNVLQYLISCYTQEKGVRQIKKIIDCILSKVNMIVMCNSKKITKQFFNIYKKITLPITITREFVDKLVPKKHNSSDFVKRMYL